MQETVRKRLGLRIPLLVDIQVGCNWGDMVNVTEFRSSQPINIDDNPTDDYEDAVRKCDERVLASASAVEAVTVADSNYKALIQHPSGRINKEESLYTAPSTYKPVRSSQYSSGLHHAPPSASSSSRDLSAQVTVNSDRILLTSPFENRGKLLADSDEKPLMEPSEFKSPPSLGLAVSRSLKPISYSNHTIVLDGFNDTVKPKRSID
jgi:hypothetical protein